MSFLQCPRKLWLEQYSPELEDESAMDWAAIETGNVVGAMAREIYAGAQSHRITNERGLRAAVADTAALITAGGNDTVFEATFDHSGLTVQVDILERSSGSPRLIEVKSATSLKDHYLQDCAIQAWTLAASGTPPAQIVLAHVDNSFVYAGDNNYEGLLNELDITDAVNRLVPSVPELIDRTRATLAELDEPKKDIGEHCRQPYDCPFFEHCAPPQGEYPVTGLGGRKQKLYELMLEGYSDIRDVPDDSLSSESQRLIWESTKSESPFIGPELKEFANSLPFPRYYLDFETIAFAIPIWADTKPYQALPFQWSCHIERTPGEVEHREFLDTSGEPPMRICAESLVAALGDDGPVLVYTSYEKRVLRELAERYPDMADALVAISERIVDLHPPTKAHYYHPRMLGSWSIKAVLPTIAPDLDYSQLSDVTDGQAAQTAYLELIKPETSAARRESLRKALLRYCCYDTLALLRLLSFFAGI
jgi:hypothetical protein